MRRAARRGIPDNLDPLVDTLSNVVGILVIVLALTQIELGDALARVLDRDGARARAETGHQAERQRIAAALEERREGLRQRTGEDSATARVIAEQILTGLREMPTGADDAGDAQAMLARVSELRREVARAEKAIEARKEDRSALRRTPAHLVARLPDPKLERGFVSWILVRHGRVFAVEREALLERGNEEFQRILGQAILRGVRPDEIESAALYSRKHAIGVGGFRWLLETDGERRVELVWPSPDVGVSASRLEHSAEWQRWLARRSPDEDFIRFHVWNDSFETYLATRQIVESAGFSAGWQGHASDEEIELGLTLGGRPQPRERTIEVD